MIKVAEILAIEPYALTCRFNNDMVKKLEVEPLIQQQKHLPGITSLLDFSVFKKVRIGDMGEIVWDKIVTIRHNGKDEVWDYDISPEFAFAESVIPH